MVAFCTGAVVVSPEYATMLGYDPATFVETAASWEQRLHPEDRGALTRTSLGSVAFELVHRDT